MAPKGRVVRRNILKAGALSSRAPSLTQSKDGSVGATGGSTSTTTPGGSANVATSSRGISLNSDSLGGSTNTTPAGSTNATAAGGMSLAAGDAVGGSTNATSGGSTNVTPVGGGSTNVTPVGCSTDVIEAGGNATSVTRLPSHLTTLTISDGMLCSQKKVPPVIYKIFKKIKNPTGYSWNLTPDPIKKSYWDEFKKVFTWDPALDDTVYELWHARARGRYRGFVHNMKKSKKGRPAFITAQEWEGWQNYWNSEDVKAKSLIAHNCRMSEPDGPGTGQVRHRGGSKSCLEYASELAAQRGVQTKDCLHDAFEYMHRMKDGSYTDVKSARIAKEIEELAEELRQPLPGTTEPREVDMNKCYLQVTGGLENKGRLFGGGSLAQSIMSCDSSATSASTSQVDKDAIDNRLEEMEQRLQKESEERRQLQEQLKVQQKLIEQLMSQSSQSSGHVPSTPLS